MGSTKTQNINMPRKGEARFYPAEDQKTKLRSSRHNKNPTKLRSSITPGTVLIVLSGRFRGKRVVFLKQLPSGLLLVTGPFRLNGVPLRRINQAYVIATSTKIDISKVDVSSISDDFFSRSDSSEDEKGEFFSKTQARKVGEDKIEAQKAVDNQLLPLVKAIPYMKAYLNAKFSLRNGDKPHLMKF